MERAYRCKCILNLLCWAGTLLFMCHRRDLDPSGCPELSTVLHQEICLKSELATRIQARKLEHEGPPTPNQRWKGNKHKPSYFHVLEFILNASAGQIIASSKEVTFDSSYRWEYAKIVVSLSSGFGITIVCPVGLAIVCSVGIIMLC